MDNDQFKKLQDIGRSAAESIAEMVAALNCDYERLAELRENLRTVCDELHGEQGATNSEFKAWLAKVAADANCGDYYGDVVELAELEKAAGDCESEEAARERIEQYPLSIELSGTWSLGSDPVADRALILLGTGGPATRIVCEFGHGMKPHRAWIEAQDQGTPWTQYHGDAISQDDLLAFCRVFYFGEG